MTGDEQEPQADGSARSRCRPPAVCHRRLGRHRRAAGRATAATASPSTADAMNAPRQPTTPFRNRRDAGATALPTMPAKVWIEKARPVRSSDTCCDNSA